MSRNIVFCADGTWDDPNNNSNVCQLYTALKKIDGVQVVMYDSGVGSSGLAIEKLLGGAVGAGLFQKIKDGYTDIAGQYQPGDQIFIFGFSRGAYTARSLAGMIAICGLPKNFQNDSNCVDMAFNAYRNQANRTAMLASLNATYSMDNTATIQLLGVWDTVGSLGIPAIFGDVDMLQYGFLSTTLHPNVLNAVQALAIDEHRQQFQPSLWASEPLPNQSITQAWFPGVHCDVGGGYAPDANGASASNITLLWMANYAKTFGLTFTPGAISCALIGADSVTPLHESRTGAYRIFPPHIRTIDPASILASSVGIRCATPTYDYAPVNLAVVGGQLAASYNLTDVANIVL
jgi:uncharacterized protein (DUF2235 family)